MKELIKMLTPAWLLNWQRDIKMARFKNKTPQEVFTEIYNTNQWRSAESISGTGSEIVQTQTLISDFEKLLKDLNIKSVLDIPCGDFKWMQKVNLSGVNYIGADIVADLIANNTKTYGNNSNIQFKVLNLITDKLPLCDLVFVRDCLVHLCYDDILKALDNIKASGCKYLLTTTFVKHHANYNIITGAWRKINLQIKPFNLPEPMQIINENCTEINGAFSDKSMALWEINKL